MVFYTLIISLEFLKALPLYNLSSECAKIYKRVLCMGNSALWGQVLSPFPKVYEKKIRFL